jgi:hypothetical protein
VIEITVFTKSGGPLTKRISLDADGTIKSDGSACTMSRGSAQRVSVADVRALAHLIEGLGSNQAVALGALRVDLPEQVSVVTKDRLNGAVGPDVIARTADDIVYQEKKPAFVLLDFDAKGMPRAVADRIHVMGGFWNALVSVLPGLADAAHVTRCSTSSGLSRSDTGRAFPGSGGLHAYVVAKDGTDAERFLTALHQRCWLAGFGWMMVGAAGQMLERSIVDRMVGAPERLVFEGKPIVEPPIAQDAESRRPVATDGKSVDTAAICPSLTAVELHEFRKLIASDEQRLRPEALREREAYVADRAQKLAARTGMSAKDAARIIERQCRGVLLADVELPLDALDDPEFGAVTVGMVLDNPANFEGWTLADPVEGADYGRCKAKVLRGADGTPFIVSFAHGGATYQLRYDARAVETRMSRSEDPVAELVRLAPVAELDAVETKRLVAVASVRAPGVGVRTVAEMVKKARAEHAAHRARAMRERELALRTDPRPQIADFDADAPVLPAMATVNEVLGKSPNDHPPCRDIDDDVNRVRKVKVPGMHAFSSSTANVEGDEK